MDGMLFVFFQEEDREHMDRIQIETFTRLQFVSNPSFSPDGRTIAFVVKWADLKDNGYKGDLYVYDCEKKQTKRLTCRGDVKHYTWTKGGAVLFAVAGDGKTDYYEIFLDGGEAQKKFSVELAADSVYAVDEDRYLFTAVSELEKRTESKNDAYEVVDEIPFWFNGKGFTGGTRTRLYLYQGGELTPVSDETADCSSFGVRGSKVLYKAYPWTDIHNQYDGIYLYDLDSGETKCLLEKDTMRTGMIGFWDDREALVAACAGSPYGNGKYMDFYTMDLESGEMKLLAEYDYSSGSGSVGSDARLGGGRTVKAGDGICYFITTRGYNACLYSIDRAGTITGVVTEEGSCDSFDVKDGHVVVCGLYGDKPAELYLDGEQITEFNDMSQYAVSTPEKYTFTAKDGYTLTGWVMKPVGYEPGKKYPAILNIHGGPRTVFGSVFHHEMQVWASAGYFVFYTNPRGSDGFGTEFGDINGKYGTVDYENLMDFTDFVLDHEPDIDRDRVGVTGGSYGGFMTNWVIGHTDRFRCAVSQRSIANYVGDYLLSDIGYYYVPDQQLGTIWDHPERLWKASPLTYADRVKTPTLFIHADKDYRCTLANGLEMFAALKLHGVESKLCMFYGENHGLSREGKPSNRISRLSEILGWMEEHLKTE